MILLKFYYHRKYATGLFSPPRWIKLEEMEKDSNTEEVWGIKLQMAQVLCQKLSSFTFNDKQTSRRVWDKKSATLLDPQAWRPVSVSRSLPQWQRSFPCRQEQGILVGLLVLSDSSRLPPLLLSFQNTNFDKRRDTFRLQLIFKMFLSEGITRQPFLSFLHPLNNCEIKVGGEKVWSRFLISDIWQLTQIFLL